MRLIKTGIVAAICMLVAAGPLFAQSLLNNEEYQRAQELRAQAEEAFEDGDYDAAIELTEEADVALEAAREIAERRRDGFRAANARTLADRRLGEAEGYNVSDHFPEEYEQARSLFEEGQELYGDEAYVDARERFLEVRDVLDDELIAELRDIWSESLAEAESRSNDTGESAESAAQDDEDSEQAEAEEASGAELPRYYVVRLIPERRDSFWRIAEYEFVYDDPWEWPSLYEANRDMLHDPDNPDLIHPGMRFRIPSIEGENRAGVWRDGEIIRD